MRKIYDRQINMNMKLYEMISESPAKSSEAKYSPKALGDIDMQKILLAQGKKIADYIKTNCKPWLSQTNNGRLYVYRGFSNESSLPMPAFTKAVRPDRVPRDSSKDWHMNIDYAIRIAGKKANRSNSLFTTGDEDQASEYGAVFVVLPIGAFNYTWHTDISDWVNAVNVGVLFQKSKTPVKPEASKKPDSAEVEAHAKKRAKYESVELKEITEFTKKLRKHVKGANVLDSLSIFVAATTGAKSWYGPTQKYLQTYAGPKNNPFPNLDLNIPSHKRIGLMPFDTMKGGPTRYSHVRPGYGSSSTDKKLDRITKVAAFLKSLSPEEKAHAHGMVGKLHKYLASWMLVNNSGDVYPSSSGAWSPSLTGSSFKYTPTDYHYPTYEAFLQANKSFNASKGAAKQYNKKSIKAATWVPGRDPIETLDMKNFNNVFGKYLKGDDKSLSAAIKSENEIMIAAGSAIAIQPDFYTDIVIPLLQGRKPRLSQDTARYFKTNNMEDDF